MNIDSYIIETTLARSEGRYVNDKNDKGGETYRGISRVHFPDWIGWKIIDGLKRKNPNIDLNSDIVFKTLNSDVLSFYKKEWYERYRVNEFIYPEVKLVCFDLMINRGSHGVIVDLQEAINKVFRLLSSPPPLLKVDGVFGNKTKNALRILNNESKITSLITKILTDSQQTYEDRSLNVPGQSANGLGWDNRIYDLCVATEGMRCLIQSGELK